jgi:YidC/Oxa1 family membrane protein insertase
MEERRLLLAVALSLVVLTAYSLLFSPSPRPAPTPMPAPAVTTPSGATGPSAASTRGAATPEASPATRAPEVAAVADERERRVEVIGPAFTVAFSNRGARPVSWTLSRYRDARGAPEEMVPAAGSGGVRPLDVETGDPELDARLRGALFRPSSETITLAAGRAATLSFEYAEGELEARKTLEFQPTGLVAVSVTLRRAGRELPGRLLWGPGIGNPTAAEREVQGYQEPAGVALTAAGVERHKAASLPETGQSLGAVRWVGVESHYFAALFIVPGAGDALLRRQARAPLPDEKPAVLPVVAVDAGGGPVQLFVGAKDYEALARLGHGLERVVPVGDWIGPIVVPLMRLLRLVQGRVGNWGWSIVVLTVLINLAMAPLRHYSIVNGIKMAKLGPEMRQIQDRFRKVPLMDPRRQQMQDEVAALYARHGMSMGSQMMVGCLPLLLTMPFLIAFYRVLTVSVELRGASYLWIPDLAQKDPLFLTPVLMGVSMFAMQKLTPSTLDPAQQRIMMLMPLMLAGMFLWAPAGLNLYWLTSNLWSLVQQGVSSVSMRLLQPGRVPAARERKGR